MRTIWRTRANWVTCSSWAWTPTNWCRAAKDRTVPIYNEDLRLKLVTACGAVDYAIIMEDWSILMRLACPHVIVVSPTTKDADTMAQRVLAEQVGAQLVHVPSRSQTHTSDIIQRIVSTRA